MATLTKIYLKMEQAKQRELQNVKFKDKRNTMSEMQASPVFQEILHGASLRQ